MEKEPDDPLFESARKVLCAGLRVSKSRPCKASQRASSPKRFLRIQSVHMAYTFGRERPFSSSKAISLGILTNLKVRTSSCVETNRACASAVTISSFAYNSPKAVLIDVMWNTEWVKRTTGDLVQATTGAISSCVIGCIKAINARGSRAQTRS